MREFIFATHNNHKLEEIRKLVSPFVSLVSLSDIHCDEDIPETELTLEGNAQLKARHIYSRFHKNCFADDTGLEIAALGGKPGVFSARYAGEHCSFVDNVNKVLKEMQGVICREAQFRTVICLIEGGKEYFFEGICKGEILSAPIGEGGFGYDPIFLPENQKLSFAEMDMQTKNRISHRGLAMEKLINHLRHDSI